VSAVDFDIIILPLKLTIILLSMNYFRVYFWLMEKSSKRQLQGYTERHHVNPKCMGGTNDKCNIVVLTPKEHFLAHRLLVKMYPNNGKLKFALRCMTISGRQHQRVTGKLYAKFKEELALEISKLHKGKVVSEETRAKMSASSKKRQRAPLSKEHKETLRRINLGRKHTQTTLDKLKSIAANTNHTGASNYNAKEMTVTSPTGEAFKIKGQLQSFCEERGFTFSSLCKSLDLNRPLKSGKSKGWKAEYGWF